MGFCLLFASCIFKSASIIECAKLDSVLFLFPPKLRYVASHILVKHELFSETEILKQEECQTSYCKRAKDRKKEPRAKRDIFSAWLAKGKKKFQTPMSLLEQVVTLNVQHYEAHFAETTRSKCGLICFPLVSASIKH